MPSIKFSGPLRFRLKGFLALNKIAIATYLNHAASRKIHPDWDANMEIGVRFIRHQFKRIRPVKARFQAFSGCQCHGMSSSMRLIL